MYELSFKIFSTINHLWLSDHNPSKEDEKKVWKKKKEAEKTDNLTLN